MLISLCAYTSELFDLRTPEISLLGSLSDGNLIDRLKGRKRNKRVTDKAQASAAEGSVELEMRNVYSSVKKSIEESLTFSRGTPQHGAYGIVLSAS